MKDHDEERVSQMPMLLVGAGRKAHELGAVLHALAEVRMGRGDAFRVQVLVDLEELLSRRSSGGMAILEYEGVPLEDIGFVRRFLERNPTWKLLVLGKDAQDGRAQAMLALARTQWLPWPPDLDQLGALLPAEDDAAPEPPGVLRPVPAASGATSIPAAPPEASGMASTARAVQPGAAPNAESTLDVGGLLEELLAGASLSGQGSPRYRYGCESPLLLPADAGVLADGLVGLFTLARRCAGEGNVVSVQADHAPVDDPHGLPEGSVRIRADFPLGPLTDGDLPGLLEDAFEGDGELAADVAAANDGAELLRAHGALVELAPHRPGRLRLEVLLPHPGGRPAEAAATERTWD